MQARSSVMRIHTGDLFKNGNINPAKAGKRCCTFCYYNGFRFEGHHCGTDKLTQVRNGIF